MKIGHERVDWVDTAKGLCIVFVVMMHSTLGVGIAMGGEGFMHEVVAFARPFRMPDFFLISGLFLGLVIDRPWRRYLDRKVVHFAYFYVLWLTIQFAFKAPGMAMENGVAGTLGDYLLAFFQPFGTLWFIYILPIFFVFTRLVRTLPVWFVFAWAAVLEMLPIHTGWLLFDEFCARFVYFYAGYAFASRIFDLAEWLRASPARCVAILGLWAPINALLVFVPAPEALAFLIDPESHVTGGTGGLAELPVVSLLLGGAGALSMGGLAGLARRPFHRDLSRLLPADGRLAGRSDARLRRRRAGLATGHDLGRARTGDPLWTDPLVGMGALPLRAPRVGVDRRAPEGRKGPATGGVNRGDFGPSEAPAAESVKALPKCGCGSLRPFPPSPQLWAKMSVSSQPIRSSFARVGRKRKQASAMARRSSRASRISSFSLSWWRCSTSDAA
jgi:fucose 4-O-acetylase-like acetyltransferase